ncbi:MAG: hypothetical protein JW902_14555 [Syntrophaceae bacterium]|nr:hypothetical protein [Syntrophaceae bacterium]
MDKKEDMEYERIQVECHSGHEANLYPVAFTFQGRRWEVLEIVDRWYEGGIKPERPAIHYFKVKTNQDRIFMLMYIVHQDEWCVLV